MDVKSDFLNGILQEEVYVQQPPGYQILGHEHKFYRLKKDLYGLKQAPRAWYSRIDSYFQSHGFSHGFSKCSSEPTLYIKVNNQGKVLIVCLYVDDLIFTGKFSIELFKSTMKKQLNMKFGKRLWMKKLKQQRKIKLGNQ